MQPTVVEYLSRLYQQRQLSSLLSELVFEQGFNVSTDREGDSSAALNRYLDCL